MTNHSPNDTALTTRLRNILKDVEYETHNGEQGIESELSIALGLLRAWQIATEREYQTDELHKLRKLTREICGEV